ncbi:MAG: hypothetical protein ACR2PK_08000 [Acidimicrobiales bacterium]
MVADGSGVTVVVGAGEAVAVGAVVGDEVEVGSVNARSSGAEAASTASVSLASDTPIAATSPAKAAVVPPAMTFRLRVPARRRGADERRLMMVPLREVSAKRVFNFRRVARGWSMNPGRST